MGAKVVILPFSTKFFKYFLPFSTKFISVICHFPPNLVGKPVFESMWVSWVMGHMDNFSPFTRLRGCIHGINCTVVMIIVIFA